MDEIKESIKTNLKEKLSSPFYGTFIASWVLWNWKAFYLTLFVDSEIIFKQSSLNKLDYLMSYYKSTELISLFGKALVYPLLSTCFIVFLMPKITFLFYKKSLETDLEYKLEKEKREDAYLKLKGENLDREVKVLKQESVVEKLKLEKNPEEQWDVEFNQIKKTKQFNNFDEIKNSLYVYNGSTRAYTNTNREWELMADTKAYFDSNGIIEIFKDNNNQEKIKLTEKGKYLMKKYLDYLQTPLVNKQA